jgi:hypothetical protein
MIGASFSVSSLIRKFHLVDVDRYEGGGPPCEISLTQCRVSKTTKEEMMQKLKAARQDRVRRLDQAARIIHELAMSRKKTRRENGGDKVLDEIDAFFTRLNRIENAR